VAGEQGEVHLPLVLGGVGGRGLLLHLTVTRMMFSGHCEFRGCDDGSETVLGVLIGGPFEFWDYETWWG